MASIELMSEYQRVAVEAAGMKSYSELPQVHYPMLIDPSGQELEWLFEYESTRLPSSPLPPKQEWGTETVYMPLEGCWKCRKYKIGPPKPDPGDGRYISADHWALKDRIEYCMSEGLTLIVANVNTCLSRPLLDVLERKLMQGWDGNMYVNVSHKPMLYNPNFRLYLITSLSLPQLPTEQINKVTLVNSIVKVAQVSMESPPDKTGNAIVVFTELSGCEVARLPMEVSTMTSQGLIEMFAQRIGAQPYSCDLINPNGDAVSTFARDAEMAAVFPELAQGFLYKKSTSFTIDDATLELPAATSELGVVAKAA